MVATLMGDDSGDSVVSIFCRELDRELSPTRIWVSGRYNAITCRNFRTLRMPHRAWLNIGLIRPTQRPPERLFGWTIDGLLLVTPFLFCELVFQCL